AIGIDRVDRPGALGLRRPERHLADLFVSERDARLLRRRRPARRPRRIRNRLIAHGRLELTSEESTHGGCRALIPRPRPPHLVVRRMDDPERGPVALLTSGLVLVTLDLFDKERRIAAHRAVGDP